MNRLTRATACLLAAFALVGQNIDSATLQGVVRDAHDVPVAAARVQAKNNSRTFSVETDAQGRYRFPALRPGTYSLRASTEGAAVDLASVVLGPKESRSIDLRLGSSGMPQYSDLPSFIVAGVNDGANRGGHGSDPILHSSDALARATASLGAGERPGDEVETVRAYQRAAEQDPSESHLFDWGAELLSHRAAEQAAEVFGRGNRLFPRSTRMLLGLAVSQYSRGSFDQAQQSFFTAADLNPGDPTPYLFLGQVRNSPIGQSDGFLQRMERFARLQPDNAWANYYYAATLRFAAPARARTLLEKAVRIDSRLAAAWLQLGILFAEQDNFSQAISAWQRAIVADPAMIEAHYRLSQVYRRTGEPAKAKAEIEIHEQLSKQSAAAEERERASIREFVFTLRDH
jgi:Flp pilus assembly protein TadD